MRAETRTYTKEETRTAQTVEMVMDVGKFNSPLEN